MRMWLRVSAGLAVVFVLWTGTALAQGKPLPANLVNTHTNNGKQSVPSVILAPVAVTKANIESTVVKDGYWTAAQICTSAYASACKSAGIK